MTNSVDQIHNKNRHTQALACVHNKEDYGGKYSMNTLWLNSAAIAGRVQPRLPPIHAAGLLLGYCTLVARVLYTCISCVFFATGYCVSHEPRTYELQLSELHLGGSLWQWWYCHLHVRRLDCVARLVICTCVCVV